MTKFWTLHGRGQSTFYRCMLIIAVAESKDLFKLSLFYTTLICLDTFTHTFFITTFGRHMNSKIWLPRPCTCWQHLDEISNEKLQENNVSCWTLLTFISVPNHRPSLQLLSSSPPEIRQDFVKFLPMFGRIDQIWKSYLVSFGKFGKKKYIYFRACLIPNITL